MRVKTRTITLAAMSVGLLLTIPSWAQAPAAVPLCNACHGPNGISALPTVPTIAGLSALAFENALYAYREGERPCATGTGPTASTPQQRIDMCAPARNLAETDISSIADYYAALPFVAATQQTDSTKAALGKAIHDRGCEICHSQGGSNATDDASILAGQPMEYLRLVLTEYAAATRSQPRPMEVSMVALGAADIDALVHFYARER